MELRIPCIILMIVIIIITVVFIEALDATIIVTLMLQN